MVSYTSQTVNFSYFPGSRLNSEYLVEFGLKLNFDKFRIETWIELGKLWSLN